MGKKSSVYSLLCTFHSTVQYSVQFTVHVVQCPAYSLIADGGGTVVMGIHDCPILAIMFWLIAAGAQLAVASSGLDRDRVTIEIFTPGMVLYLMGSEK